VPRLRPLTESSRRADSPRGFVDRRGFSGTRSRCRLIPSVHGLAALDALEESTMLHADDQALISAVLDAVVEPLVDIYHQDDVVREVE
jgi:hypothetical protein